MVEAVGIENSAFRADPGNYRESQETRSRATGIKTRGKALSGKRFANWQNRTPRRTQGRADVGDVPTAETLGTLARKVLSSSRHAESRELARAVSAAPGTSERRQVTTQSSDPVGARSDKRRVAERDAVFFLEEQAELDAADGQDGLRRVVRRVENELQVRRHPEVLGEQDLPVGFDAVLVA